VFRRLHGKHPSDETIRREIRRGKLPNSGGGVVWHVDLLAYFHLTDDQLADMLAAIPDELVA
jgi:hypothetical protein